jgi:hypothetical protein
MSRAGGRPILFVVGAIVVLVLLIVFFAKRGSPLSTSSATNISAKNPALKDSVWEADGARLAIFGAKEVCKEAGARLLEASSVAEWTNVDQSFGEETSPGRYHVRRRLSSRNSSGTLIRATVDCKIRRDGDHFQVISADSGR